MDILIAMVTAMEAIMAAMDMGTQAAAAMGTEAMAAVAMGVQDAAAVVAVAAGAGAIKPLWKFDIHPLKLGIESSGSSQSFDQILDINKLDWLLRKT